MLQLQLDDGHYFNNILAARRFEARKKMSKHGQPVKKDV